MATPFQNKHAFDPRGFGNYLFNVTEVDPANPGDAKPISSFTKKGLERLMAKHNVQAEINLDKDKETLPNIVDAVLSHYKETGILKGILLPFITEKSLLQEPDELLYDINKVWLNYGPNGKGGQRNPKPRHILEMIRKWQINLLTVGMARRNVNGEVFVNEGQQRSIAAAILGKTKMCYQCIISDDDAWDPIAYKGENSGKLSQSNVETYESDAIIISNHLEKSKQGPHTELGFDAVQEITKLHPEADEYIHYKMKRILNWNRNYPIEMVNSDAPSKERFSTGHCSNYNQMFDIFETPEYTMNDDRVVKSALNFYQQVWSKRALITGDLILFLEFFYFNQDWFYKMSNEDQEYFLIRMKNAIQPVWVDNDTAKAGAGNKAVWNIVQDARKDNYPNKTIDEQQKNGIYYKYASPRVAQCMWIGTALYSLLKARMVNEYNDADKLVQPFTTTDDGTEITYDKLSVA
jgi:hypothetical protein